MAYPQRSIEVTIVDAETVRQYARRELAEEETFLVEETLLDDDRARDLVEAETRENEMEPLEGEALEKASEALQACTKCVAYYEILTKVDGPATVQKFAENRFGERWALLEEIREALPPNKRDIVQSVRIPVQGENDRSEAVIEAAQAEDQRLLSRLRDAFRAKSSPQWKSRLARRISQIHEDKAEISWLTSAFA